jgi:hypothetical protein
MLKAFDCNVKGSTFPPTTIYHITAGKAKYKFWRDVTESWPDVKYTQITVCRGSDHPNKNVFDEFLRTATYRCVPFARIGMLVEIGGLKGEIAGKNSSANLDVLFLEGPHKGLILNCHPNYYIKYFDAEGRVIREFGK